MLKIPRTFAAGVAAIVLAGLGLGGCSGRVAAQGSADSQDPCTLLSASEAAPYVGALLTPPYRVSDGAADVHGDQCRYLGHDGRSFTVQPAWSGGAAAGKVAHDVPNLVGGALAKAGDSGHATMTHQVMKSELTGPWDQATWIPGGSLLATKGDVDVNVDVSGSSGLERDAVAIATLIMPRFAHPLSYDGAKAVALAPKAVTHPANACDFVPRSVVEAAIGPLSAEPTSDSPETSCTWKVATPQGERDYTVEFVWQNGGKNYNSLKHSMATVGAATGMPANSPLDTMQLPAQMKGMLGGMVKMVGGAGSAGKAPGATSTMGFRTDTTLTGPWDNASLLHGTQLIAVRHDVFVGMGLESADYDHAKALMAAICSRL
ncbi:MAG TPA: hypothetical protein VGM77_03245 [Gemmatimonadales bacterium]|jgi:hypothetical protein